MIVVADTSVILNLCCIGHEYLLQSLFRRVLVPTEVASEFVRLTRSDTRFAGLSLPAWIEVIAAPPVPAVVAAAMLDLGEAAAIALCIAQSADALLIDETLGRAVAKRLGIKTVGILAVLLDARDHALIPKVAPILDRLESEAGFWISPRLRAHVLKRAQE